ncbi:unnamed protein product [Peronospora belbahrii]|uniref:Expansin-like EG45 domain-containing protein n=1 Tax=Peronospora belbahrii TaxID=622444 RepID=A0AAU9KTW3_9STRA|nr:unnamed protein product [Peronospora belbahrii]CAH0519895.1 unnamed protein product [Peronospora belbahrii]
MFGTCRLKGITASSENFRLYASVSNKDFKLNEACARCITVSRTDDPSKTTSAYVLDVCDGCASGSLRLSADAMAALKIVSSDTTTQVSYAFDTCPESLLSGNIKACIMEGGSSTYVPLQFYNSKKPIQSATIEGVTAMSISSNFLFAANPEFASSDWYESVSFSVTSNDNETLSGNFAFTDSSGCATSDVQFYSASTSGGVDGNTRVGSSGAIIGAIAGGIGALMIIVGSAILIQRRKRSMKDPHDPENDVENQYLSPTSKPKAMPAATYRSDHNDHQPPASPTANYTETFSPAAKANVPGSEIRNIGSLNSSPVAAVAVPAATVAASAAVNTLSLPDYSPAVSTSNSRVLPVERSPPPKPANVAPTYAFSSTMSTSPHSVTMSNVKDVPKQTAPVVPFQSTNTDFYEDDAEEERSSFDIDDMRESEARGMSTGRMGSQPLFAPYMTADPYATTMTSPQSSARATGLRRPNAKQNSLRTPSRESGQYNNSLATSNADSYASTAPRQTNGSLDSNGIGLQSASSTLAPAAHDYSFSRSINTGSEMDSPMRDSDATYAAQHNSDLPVSQRSMGSTRESGGYSRESLNILGYPYSKKSGRHHNTTEMQF